MAFNDTVMRFAFESPNAGPLENATHTGISGTPGAGRYIKICIRVEDDIVIEAKWESNGCPAAMSCASVVCQIACGKRFSDLRNLSESLESKDVILILRGLPEGKEPMAQMAVNALKESLVTRIGESKEDGSKSV